MAFKDRRLLKAVMPVVKDSSVKLEFGNRVIDEIIRRTTQDNVDYQGKEFAAYSDSYIKSPVFEIYDKSRGDVNLTLSGEMLASMYVKESDSTGITIQFKSQDQNDKAHGHIHGIPKRVGKRLTKVSRDFFGIEEDDQIKILKSVIKDFNINDASFKTSEKAQAILEEANLVNTEDDNG